MEDAGPEAVDKHAAKSHSDKAEVATIDIHLVRAILSALASINNARKRVDDHDISKATLVLADPSSSSSCEELREILARAHRAKDIIMAQHRARIANTSRIRLLLATLPPLFIEQLPVPSCPPLKKFELFEKLPKEIRIMIYELMVAEPRYPSAHRNQLFISQMLLTSSVDVSSYLKDIDLVIGTSIHGTRTSRASLATPQSCTSAKRLDKRHYDTTRSATIVDDCISS